MPVSKYKFIKDGWGSRPLFQASYGLKMTPEDIEEGNRILEALMEDEEEGEQQAIEEEQQANVEKQNMSDSKYKIIKDFWGSRRIFQASYGLKMTPEDLEEGDSILEALMEAEEEDRAVRQQAEEEKKGKRSKQMGCVYEELINALERERQQQNVRRY
jgi:hypothetical protein